MDISPLRFLAALLISVIGLASISSAQLAFQFNFTDSGSGFNDPTLGTARRTALEEAAQSLINQLSLPRQVTLQFDVSSVTEDNDTLASAGSGVVGTDNGFLPTVAQHKAQTGVDSNGSEADGQINWNFSPTWDLDDSVAEDAYDFKSTAIHEILHAMGFLGAITSTGGGIFEEPGQPDG
jgi:hypothetical protein